MLIYKSGVAKVCFAELPKEVQKRFGYDTDKTETEQAAARAAEEKRVEEQKAAQRQRTEKGRKTESKLESKVSVKRQIEVTDELLFAITTWSMTLSPRDLSFIWTKASAGVADSGKIMSFSDPEDAADALAKFVEWDETARRNNAESFGKKINDKCTSEFSHGASTLEYYWKTPSGAFSGEFIGADVDKFNELLKQLPEAKAELESKSPKRKKNRRFLSSREKYVNY